MFMHGLSLVMANKKKSEIGTIPSLPVVTEHSPRFSQ